MRFGTHIQSIFISIIIAALNTTWLWYYKGVGVLMRHLYYTVMCYCGFISGGRSDSIRSEHSPGFRNTPGSALQSTGAASEAQPASIHHQGTIIRSRASIVCVIMYPILVDRFSCIWLMQELWAKSFLHHNDRHSCFHWPGAAFTLLVVLGLLCCYGKQPKGRWVRQRVCLISMSWELL